MTASAVYTRMQVAMREQPHPARLRFSQHLEGHGISIHIREDRFGNTNVVLVAEAQTAPVTFDVVEDDLAGTERTTDETTQAVYPDQRLYWTATWNVMHDIGLRPPAPTTPHPQASVDPSADALALSDRDYTVELGGDATVDGVPAFHLRLRARGSRDAHPLTDLFVDSKTFLIRQAVMAFRNEELIAGDSGTFVFDFDRVGRYWLVTHGRIDASEHGLMTRRSSGYALFTNDEFSF